LKDNPKKIIIYEYDDPDKIVDKFCLENSKYLNMKINYVYLKILKMLKKES
jgi:hypothetical protein